MIRIQSSEFKTDPSFQIQVLGMNLVCASVAHCSSIVAVAAFGVFLGVILIHYSVTTADSGGRWYDRRDTVAISFSVYDFKEESSLFT